ncbi:MAG TPA: bifunctional methylenetetrahydrofolate dehydrogenase/methenyltetrahydrofolate cyclohydrolase FolD [Anaerolineae bacterium]|nr:bifunctional methylenetetrahydrofolate dehydrogenase/methenyltetrahydrofolate cyclohydrolase FolD [Caldilineae bacterium]HID33770.1 bifunctional methylenetetrahydrofolate dehydrogenase/methenyltetrahydrofolate cyclohydrolase FolD [Anaerolineae bacterium]
MTAQIIDGKAIAATIRSEIADEVAKIKESFGVVPGLATVLVGDRKDSQTYVRMKKKACAEVGITSFGYDLPGDVSQEELLQLVRELNANPDIDGILVQLPLPDHIDEERVLAEIDIAKDVDGFHPVNIGRLAMKGRKPLFTPCTPRGIIELLDRSGIEIEGKNAVVLGRSNIVGLPVSMLLLHRNATITICHSRTKNLPEVTRRADILVAAIGRAQMVRGDWIQPGAAVIDVGVNAVDDPTAKKGYRLVGDVNFEEAKEVAGYITPVPGGVGPMTIAMLLKNTLDARKRRLGLIDG